MFFVDEPYVSDLFKKTVRYHSIPVVETPMAKQLDMYPGTTILSEEEARKQAGGINPPLVYTTSENALAWLSERPEFNYLSEKAELFKNKIKFRELSRPLFPDFYFTEVRVEDLTTFSFSEVPLPCIIKPALGFFSMGVYKVSHEDEWPGVVAALLKEITEIKDLYPTQVLDISSFIIEQRISGEEFAVDAYFTATGEPVILGILKHSFSSREDMSDRVYTSSKEIIEENLEEFTAFIGELGKLADLKNFPVHVELRRQPDGLLLPIEVNPLRFGGWCTTAELSFFAYGFNPYLYYHRGQKPDWAEFLKGKEEKLFSLIVLDNSTGLNAREIASFDYDQLLESFEKPLELRKVDYTKYPVFGFVFTETQKKNEAELNAILKSDLREFIELV